MDDELDGQIWPSREYFCAVEVEEDGGKSISFEVVEAKTAKEAVKKINDWIMKSGNFNNPKGHTITSMNRV